MLRIFVPFAALRRPLRPTLASMRFGNTSTFAIDCVHENVPNERGWVFGRMCIWARELQLGDFEEPSCMLNVTGGHLERVMGRLQALDEPSFEDLTDSQLYELLDRAVYRDDDRTAGQVAADSERYFKHDFLTNGGESFDRFKSFIATANGRVRIVFAECSSGPNGVSVDMADFVSAVTAFLGWLKQEARNVG
ncbi:hypothetical protein [Niveibacterium sp. COAC-50]|uniref:hypothetical protein n=1 Tax=Niveibacterium sp. COAC-50 TaxID=2729384 RepID=UPI0015570EF1|nr:hypothetical protein [Niveibacterium sp. COAC-50]